MYRSLILIILTSFFALSCADEDPPAGPGADAANIRLLHLNFDGGNLDLRVDNVIVKSNTTHPASSGYGPTTPGRFDVSVHNTGDAASLKSSSQNLSINAYHSIYAFPPTNAFAAGFSVDRVESSPGTAAVKFVNASYNSLDLNEKWELYITGKTTPMFDDVRRLGITTYFTVATGRYSFTLRKSDDPDVVFTYEEVELLDASAYTVVLHGTPDESDQYPLGLRMYNDDIQGTSYVDLVKAANVSNLMYIMAIHGSEAVNIAVDGAVPQITNLKYRENTDYLTFAAGDHKYGVEASAQAYLIDQPIRLDPQQSYSVVLTGTKTPRDIVPMHLLDPSSPDPANVLLRFIHLAPESGNVSVILKDGLGPGNDYNIPGMQDIAYRTISTSSANPSTGFVQFPNAGTYTLLFKDVVKDSVVATFNNVRMDLGKVYTLWYGGLESNNDLRGNILTHND